VRQVGDASVQWHSPRDREATSQVLAPFAEVGSRLLVRARGGGGGGWERGAREIGASYRDMLLVCGASARLEWV